METLTEAHIRQWLEAVKDPEIPVLSLVDLGVIRDISIQGQKVKVVMTPTFSGCPAIDMMKQDVQEVLKNNGVEEVEVEVNFKTAWNSNLISEKGRAAIKKFGLAPPPMHNLIVDIDIIEKAKCPRCDGENTEMKTPFGPTLCRSIHYCYDCREAFEQFKPL
ncbi:1,2-phenylacetyl-CoA epoxidase subunit PaaD [Cytophagales bacterium LB-30]|uniref:1,2-phenylacetyl-CoA epoxidase subunit PaaD n=1 Tax=Shiella aurantiaca TaxID=3058365 RepID=A0ABT8F3I7_9BACT|nr:1,2-phenylacetyl-CoA epoxidase subunit PaaD [Shiella aurantiaca]MDN4164987.1 1,2-phenylacetyl-CoA epoxidase subunit PaaD [Shiella aurantiaca]